MRILFFLLGAFSLLAQTILAREFLSVFFGNEISVGLFYFSWLLFTGLGSALALKKKVETPGFSRLLWLASPLFLLEILLIRSSKLFLDVSSFGGIVPFFQLSAAAFIVNLPLPVSLGFLFPNALKFMEDRGSRTGAIFLFEALGTMISGILFTYLLIGRFSIVYLILITVLTAVLAKFAFSHYSRQPRQQLLSLFISVTLTAALFTPFPRLLETGLSRLSMTEYKGKTVKTLDSRWQRLTLTRYKKQYTVYANGKVSFSFPDYQDASVLSALLVSQAKNPARILLIGQGMGGFLPELLKYHPQHIDYLEPDPELLGLVKPYLDKTTVRSLQDKRVKIHTQDGISYLRGLKAKARYDLILNFSGDPGSAQINRFYTREFLKICREHLTGKGVVVSILTSAPNYLGEELLSYNGSVYATFKQVFKQVLVLPGDRNIFLATKAESVLDQDVEEIKRRYRRYAPQPVERIAQSFGPLMEAGRIKFLGQALAAGTFKINS
ncbi:MAG: spermidine synthase, partial [bacterium]